MTRLRAIWKILTSEHFLLLTGTGACYGIVPANSKKTELFYELAKKISEMQEEPK